MNSWLQLPYGATRSLKLPASIQVIKAFYQRFFNAKKMILRIVCILLFVAKSLNAADTAEEILAKRRSHRALDLSDDQLEAITSQLDEETFKYYLDNILIPRVPGSVGHNKVRDFIAEELQKIGWTVSIDSFRARVPQPFGTLTFENIIATPNPSAERYLVYAAHYDSKWFADNPNFVAATDSAVSCAMMLTIAKALANDLADRSKTNDLSIMFVFFDGEEAIQQWTASDSIYGARHLAKKWQKENFLPRIDMMVLLDLIGATDPKFYNFFPGTQKWYGRLLDAEQKLGTKRQLSRLWQKPNTYFQSYSLESFIEDDHVPFLKRGVPIVHLITYPFPDVWHKPSDDASAIDYHSVYDLNKILTVFVAEYLHMGTNQGSVDFGK